MKVYINCILHPIKTLGPGKRVGIWFQGCDIKCKGCMSKHTWELKDEFLTTTDKVLRKVKESGLDKVTISGGEPFQQANALKNILEGLKELGIEDIIIYSGMKKEQILKKYKWIKDLCSLLISEPFVEDKPSNMIWKGSENQQATIFKNESYYKNWLNKEKDKKVQIIGNLIVGIM